MIGHLQRLVLVVGDMYACETHLTGHGAELLPQIYPQTGIQRPERLVEQQDLGTRCQSACERYALLLTSGQLPGKPIRLLLQMDHVEHAPHYLLGIGLRPPLDLRREHHVVVDGEMREQRIRLRQHGGVP